MSDAPEKPKFVRKSRKSILDIGRSTQLSKGLGLRSDVEKNSFVFKTGRVKYEPIKYLSSALTPPPPRKSRNQNKKKAVDKPFKLNPVSYSNITHRMSNKILSVLSENRIFL